MNYELFTKILNKHIFEDNRIKLFEKIANSPERFLGLFRPSKPHTKILQHLLQSAEILMGDAFENIIKEIFKGCGYQILHNKILTEDGRLLDLDQFFKKDNNFYLIEQKLRDDHDSSKKVGQIQNFENKIETLRDKVISDESVLIGIMYFIDPDFLKNKRYYLEEISKLSKFYGVELHLFYGKELFEYFQCPEIWDNMLEWLKTWKDNLPNLPDIDLDKDPEISFYEIKDIKPSIWRYILINEDLWKEGIIASLFSKGETLKLLNQYFKSKNDKPYKELAKMLSEKLEKYYMIYYS
jgi:hypothetical protein